jgi:hypothetical protein
MIARSELTKLILREFPRGVFLGDSIDDVSDTLNSGYARKLARILLKSHIESECEACLWKLGPYNLTYMAYLHFASTILLSGRNGAFGFGPYESGLCWPYGNMARVTEWVTEYETWREGLINECTLAQRVVLCAYVRFFVESGELSHSSECWSFWNKWSLSVDNLLDLN